MHWLLVISVLEMTPFATNLVFRTLDECLQAEQLMRSEQARVYNEWLTWAKANPNASGYPDPNVAELQQRRIGMGNRATCLPYAAPK